MALALKRSDAATPRNYDPAVLRRILSAAPSNPGQYIDHSDAAADDLGPQGAGILVLDADIDTSHHRRAAGAIGHREQRIVRGAKTTTIRAKAIPASDAIVFAGGSVASRESILVSALGRILPPESFYAEPIHFNVLVAYRPEREGYVLTVVTKRLQVLQDDARESGEAISAPSQRALLGFLDRARPTAVPNVFQLENGNLRAVWKDGNGAQLAAEFIDDKTIHYVIFARKNAGETTTRAAGLAGSEGVLRIAEAMKIKDLLGS